MGYLAEAVAAVVEAAEAAVTEIHAQPADAEEPAVVSATDAVEPAVPAAAGAEEPVVVDAAVQSAAGAEEPAVVSATIKCSGASILSVISCWCRGACSSFSN